MVRDMDLVREILLEIEGGKRGFDVLSREDAEILGESVEGRPLAVEVEVIEYHLNLLHDAKFITITGKLNGGLWTVGPISWSGHDLIDSIRDPVIWKETKSAAKKAGGFTVDLLKELAKGFIKTKLEQHTGIKIDI